MSKERKAEMIEMRENGYTYHEIGKAFGISRQRVQTLIGGQMKSHFRRTTPEDCIYPNLRKWMNDNRITRAELCRRLYGDTHPNNRAKCCEFLKGINQRASKRTIDKYLSVTGLTYEELFATEGGERYEC